MYAPCARSSLASVCSTRLNFDVTFFALSFGTVCPQFVHCTVPEDPFPPLVRPLLARFSGIILKLIFLHIILWLGSNTFVNKFSAKKCHNRKAHF